MIPREIVEPQSVASDSSAELSRRIAALKGLGSTGDVSTIPVLKGLLGKPASVSAASKNWDPPAAQRVVDLHAIAVLHQLGDDSELHRIPALVIAAGSILQGSDDERRNAVTVIAEVGSVAVVRDLVAVLPNLNAAGVANVIEVLDTLRLPEAPVRQNLEKFAGVAVQVTGVTASLRDLMSLVTSAAKRSVRISTGAGEMIDSGASPIGRTELKNTKLSFLLQSFLPGLGLDYYTDGRRCVICTFAESAERWRNWLANYGAQLAYSYENRNFFLREP